MCPTAAVNVLTARGIENKNYNGLATRTLFVDFVYACLSFISILPTRMALICLVSYSVEWNEDFD
jgi:hypothetical protein